MRNVLAIFQREFASYFDSPLAYIVVPAFLGLVGGFSLFFQDFILEQVDLMQLCEGLIANVCTTKNAPGEGGPPRNKRYCAIHRKIADLLLFGE